MLIRQFKITKMKTKKNKNIKIKNKINQKNKI